MEYVTKERMREIEKDAIENRGIPVLKLMEAAGIAVVTEVMKRSPKGYAAIFCGYGNNGGDGMVAVRHLFKKGYGVKCFIVGPPRTFSPETNANLEQLLKLGITPEIISSAGNVAKVVGLLSSATIIVDAIFGIGIKPPLKPVYTELIDVLNAHGLPIIAVDIPTGLDADSGEPVGAAIKAVATVTMGYPKKAFENPGAAIYTGEIVVAGIGLDKKTGTADTKATAPYKTIRLREGKKGRIVPGHPWIHKAQMQKTDPAIKPGDIVTVQKSDGSFLGRGYFNPRSGMAARILTFNEELIDKRFFTAKITAAAEKRKKLLETTNAYRAVFSEADSLGGLIVDVYKDTAVFQVLTLGMERQKEAIVDCIREALKPEFIYEKSESPYREIEGMKDARGWWGDKGNSVVEIFEGSIRFLVDIEKGHKTGFYLDQRKSRAAMEAFAKNKKVLDLFCYTGGFSISAAAYGASSVRGVDIKEDWLEIARKNVLLNGIPGNIEFTKGNAFDVLRDIYKSGEKFDVIIIDPPSFLRKRESIENASKGYKDLNLIAMKTLNEGGTLATFSCSHNMPNEIFSDILKRAAADAKKKLDILKRCHQAEDHPIVKAIPETQYLKGYFMKVSSI
ncbi:MAG: NAD(P)H-hydrate epimerase [Candidatus Omnitrophota bacterium]